MRSFGIIPIAFARLSKPANSTRRRMKIISIRVRPRLARPTPDEDDGSAAYGLAKVSAGASGRGTSGAETMAGASRFRVFRSMLRKT